MRIKDSCLAFAGAIEAVGLVALDGKNELLFAGVSILAWACYLIFVSPWLERRALREAAEWLARPRANRT